MKTELILNNQSWHLQRYPRHNNPNGQAQNLQAWDSADEFILQHLAEQPPHAGAQIAVFNDEFGALACALADYQPIWHNDSYLSHQGLLHNLADNQLSLPPAHIRESLYGVREPLDVAILKIPKSNALLEHQLHWLQPWVGEHTRIIAGAKVQAIQKSTLALFERLLGPTSTSLAQKKSRLIFCQPEGKTPQKSPYPNYWRLEQTPYQICNHANVFAREKLDIGARFFLENFPVCQEKRVVDLGCGNGVLGIMALHNGAKQVDFVDESAMAIESVANTIKDNLPERMPHCQWIWGDCLRHAESNSADVVLCNPPFHRQNAITDETAWQMFKDSQRVLTRGGELVIIGNRHLDYPAKLKRLFGGYRVVASNRKFSMLSAIKR